MLSLFEKLGDSDAGSLHMLFMTRNMLTFTFTSATRRWGTSSDVVRAQLTLQYITSSRLPSLFLLPRPPSTTAPTRAKNPADQTTNQITTVTTITTPSRLMGSAIMTFTIKDSCYDLFVTQQCEHERPDNDLTQLTILQTTPVLRNE